jgi:cytochrome c-type biogenesis protein CcmH/NrfG
MNGEAGFENPFWHPVFPFCRRSVAKTFSGVYAEFNVNILLPTEENMKKNTRISYLSLLFALLLCVLIVAGNVYATDQNELYGLDEKKLAEKIEALQRSLNNSPQNYEMLKALGIAYHFKAGTDADAFASLAVDYLTKAHELNKRDYVTMCYLGAATSRMAQTTWNPISKMNYSNKGMGFMDKAARKAPDNVTVRMTRGKTSLDMPAFLGRGNLAVEDFAYLEKLIEQNPGLYDSIKDEVHVILSEIRPAK